MGKKKTIEIKGGPVDIEQAEQLAVQLLSFVYENEVKAVKHINAKGANNIAKALLFKYGASFVKDILSNLHNASKGAISNITSVADCGCEIHAVMTWNKDCGQEPPTCVYKEK